MNQNLKMELIKMYSEMSDKHFDLHGVNLRAETIRNMVAGGFVTWEDLGFSNQDLERKIGEAMAWDQKISEMRRSLARVA
jgi:hypothetical protein